MDEIKLSDHYEKKYLKKNHGHQSRPRFKIGNSRSLAGSRPSGHVPCQRRLAEKTILFDTEQHQTIDHHPIEVPYMYRKSSIQTIVSHQEKSRMNQAKSTKVVTPLVPQLPKIIHLDEINSNLYLGNRQAAEDESLLSKHKIRLIINFSKKLLTRNQNSRDPNRIEVYNIKYEDTRALTYQNWKAIVDAVLSIMDDNDERSENEPGSHHFLIVCDKGVNRSVSVAIAYAILRKGLTFDQANEYIEKKKNNKYENFNNLTNTRTKNLLRALSSYSSKKSSPSAVLTKIDSIASD